MYKVIYIMLLLLGILGIAFGYKKETIKAKDIGVKALSISLILIVLVILTIFIK
ncbi:hypothetical protein [Clostridium thermobutyricum]|uniref:hypothetical protein n=1 Tax=Clostridium thermobutyricum TaxID=29372 RepID=UPI003F51D5E2